MLGLKSHLLTAEWLPLTREAGTWGPWSRGRMVARLHDGAQTDTSSWAVVKTQWLLLRSWGFRELLPGSAHSLSFPTLPSLNAWAIGMFLTPLIYHDRGLPHLLEIVQGRTLPSPILS